MPRTYVRKKIKTYTSQDLAEAIEKVKNGELTQYSAAQQYNIPTTTLYEHVTKNKTTLKPGRPTVIPIEEEKKFAELIIIMEKWGFGLSRFEIMELVTEYVRVNNIKTPFKNNAPGPDWFINFRKRHRLSIKKAQPVEYVRRKMTDPFIIAEYFDLLENTLSDLNLFESPQFIWNLDETSLCLDPSRTKVVGQINKPCARTTHGSGKENITVLAGASASGKKLPPLIIFKGKYVWDQWMAELKKSDYDFELTYAASTNGWIETDIFYNYVKNVLIPNLGEERPVLVIYDGHSTHVDFRVVELAIQNRVTILKLPPHTSHLLQPLDIAVFKSFKTIWDAKLVEWQRKNIGTKMPKKVFAQELADTWQETNIDVIKSGFKKAGIYPFNAQVIPADKYDPDAYKRYQEKRAEAYLARTKQNLKNPKLLKEICIDFFNNRLPTSTDALGKSNTNNVTLLSQVSKSDIQTLSFVAKQSTETPVYLQTPKPIQSQTHSDALVKFNTDKVNLLSQVSKSDIQTLRFVAKQSTEIPICLQTPKPIQSQTHSDALVKSNTDKVTLLSQVSKSDVQTLRFVAKQSTEIPIQTPKPIQRQTQNLSKINIISNIIVQKAPQPPLQAQLLPQSSCTFEELILRKIQQDKKDSTTTKKKRITKGAEVITATMGKKILEETEKSKVTKAKTKNRVGKTNNKKTKVIKKKDSEITIRTAQKQEEQPGPSNIENKNKRKRQPSLDSITSVSDLMNTHSDSDIVDYIDFEELLDEYPEDEFKIYEEEPRSQKETKDVKYSKNNLSENFTDTKILTNKDLNSLSTKGKGVGKKSKSKENQVDKKEKEKKRHVERNDDDDVEVFRKVNIRVDAREKDKNEQLLEMENKDIDEARENPDTNENYKLNDSVLVRYLIRKKWKYYIGFIEEIIRHEGTTYFSINFLKTMRPQQQLTFTLSKRKDTDKVPESLIVKNINIKKDSNNEKKYYLCDDEDTIYFD